MQQARLNSWEFVCFIFLSFSILCSNFNKNYPLPGLKNDIHYGDAREIERCLTMKCEALSTLT